MISRLYIHLEPGQANRPLTYGTLQYPLLSMLIGVWYSYLVEHVSRPSYQCLDILKMAKLGSRGLGLVGFVLANSAKLYYASVPRPSLLVWGSGPRDYLYMAINFPPPLHTTFTVSFVVCSTTSTFPHQLLSQLMYMCKLIQDSK